MEQLLFPIQEEIWHLIKREISLVNCSTPMKTCESDVNQWYFDISLTLLGQTIEGNLLFEFDWKSMFVSKWNKSFKLSSIWCWLSLISMNMSWMLLDHWTRTFFFSQIKEIFFFNQFVWKWRISFVDRNDSKKVQCLLVSRYTEKFFFIRHLFNRNEMNQMIEITKYLRNCDGLIWSIDHQSMLLINDMFNVCHWISTRQIPLNWTINQSRTTTIWSSSSILSRFENRSNMKLNWILTT